MRLVLLEVVVVGPLVAKLLDAELAAVVGAKMLM